MRKYIPKLGDVVAFMSEPERAAMFMRIYWRVLLLGFVALVAWSVFFGVRQFVVVRSLSEVQSDNISAALPLDAAYLEGVLELARERDERHNALKAHPPNIKDPSR